MLSDMAQMCCVWQNLPDRKSSVTSTLRPNKDGLTVHLPRPSFRSSAQKVFWLERNLGCR